MAFTSGPYGGAVKSFIVRVWMPDRPGALGAVASRIGAAGGDVVGIEIIEQGAGRAIDELVVHLPDESRVGLLIAEVSEVDGVDVEEVRPTSDVVHDPRVEALEMAAALVEAGEPDSLLEILCVKAATVTEAEWTVVLDLGDDSIRLGHGDHPPVPWLRAFVDGASEQLVPDVIRASLIPGELVLVLGREGGDFRTRQRDRVALLARITATRWSELGSSTGPVARALDGA